MKKLTIALLSAWLFMGAMCSTTDVGDLIAKVQAATTQACSFVPTAETILAIFATNNPALSNAAAIASAICGAVAPHTGGKLATEVTVGGVPVHGYFVVK